MKEIKIFELFAGIGSVRSAFERLGVEYVSVGYSEIDKFAIKSYCTLYNDTEDNNYGDITQIKELPQGLDLLYHGSPCQDFSLAGLGQGGDVGTDTRSSLMWETCRLVQQSLPKVVIWENVKGVLTSKHRHNFDKYLDFMQSLGYSNNYEVLHGTDFDIPQTRPRIFVVSTLSAKCYNFPLPIEQTLVLADLLEHNVESKFYLSAEKMTSIEFTDKMLKTIEHNALGYAVGSRELKNAGFKSDVAGTLTARDYKDPRIVIEKIADLRYSKQEALGRVYNCNGIAPTLDTCSGGDRQAKVLETIKLADLNFIKFNAHKGGYSPNGAAPTLKCCGGGNTEAKIITETPETIVEYLEPYRTTAQGYQVYQINDNGTGAVLVDETLYCVRKLTPKEYWRLMGFADKQYKAVAEHTSNSQLYKQAGNSIIVDINIHLINELIKQDFFQIEETKQTEQLKISEVMRAYDSVYSIVDLICNEIDSDTIKINREQVTSQCCTRLLQIIKTL